MYVEEKRNNISEIYKDGINIEKNTNGIFVVYYLFSYQTLGFITNCWKEYLNEYEYNDGLSILYTDRNFQKKIKKHIEKLLKWAEITENKLESVNCIIDNTQKYIDARNNAKDILNNFSL